MNNLNYLYLDTNKKHSNVNTNDNKPKLVENNVKYFLKSVLNKCNKNKIIIYNKYYNICMFLLFTLILSSILYVKYNSVNNLQLKAQKKIKDQEYIYSKLIYYNHINNIDKQNIRNSMITNI